MPHGLLTLFNRSMRVDLRGWKGHTFRIAFAAFIYVSLLMASATSFRFGAPGLRFFSSICYLNLFFIFLAGCSFFATAITEEKEEDTLGLLKMAGMNGGSILLGKSTSRLAASILLLVIQVPFLLLAITLGGVLYWQIWAAALSLLGFLIFTANAGLFFSVICRRSGTAVGWTAIIVIGRFVFPSIWSVAAARIPWPAPWVTYVNDATLWFGQTNPFRRLGEIMSTGFSKPLICPQVVFDGVASIVLFGAAWLLFDRFTQSGHSSTPARGLLVRRRGRLGYFSAGRAWSNAFFWKEFYFLAGGKAVMTIKFVVYGLIAIGFAAFNFWDPMGIFYGNTGLIDLDFVGGALALSMLLTMTLELAVASSRLLHDEWQWKTLEMLLLLPVSVGKIGWSKIAGAMMGLIPSLSYMTLAIFLSEDVREVAFEIIFKPVGWAVILAVITFLHVVVLTSLFVKWGALPLAVLISIVLGYALSPVFMLAAAFAAFSSPQLGALPACGVFIGLCIVLQLLIGKRVEVLGGR